MGKLIKIIIGIVLIVLGINAYFNLIVLPFETWLYAGIPIILGILLWKSTKVFSILVILAGIVKGVESFGISLLSEMIFAIVFVVLGLLLILLRGRGFRAGVGGPNIVFSKKAKLEKELEKINRKIQENDNAYKGGKIDRKTFSRVNKMLWKGNGGKFDIQEQLKKLEVQASYKKAAA